VRSEISRRELLRVATRGAAALGVAGAFGATLRAGPSGAASLEPDATRWWLRGPYAPVEREVVAQDLEVEGALPVALSGLYVKNGSNPLSGESPQWFFGDGMVHGVLLDRGRAAWYRNRYVDTALLQGGGGLGASAPGGASSLSNVSVVHHAGRLLSLGEVGLPYELSASDLSTVGPFDYAGRLQTSMTAHPKIDPDTGYLHFFGYGFAPPFLTYHVADADGLLISSQEVEVTASTMMHNFAITDRDVIFWEFPVLFDLAQAVEMISDPSSDVTPYRWDASYGARLGVMPLGGPTSAIRWVEIDPCYVYHGINAFRDGDTIAMDVCRIESTFDGAIEASRPRVQRWTIDTGGPSLRFASEPLADVRGDLPSSDLRRAGRSYRHGWLANVRRSSSGIDLGGVTHVDTRTGRERSWDPGRGFQGGEWLFVPESPRAGEGEGWLLGFLTSANGRRSELVVLEATDVARGPIATVALPQRVPVGFHATWIPASTV